MRVRLHALVLVLLSLAAPAPGLADTPWLPLEGLGEVTAYVAHQQFSEYWQGVKRTDFPFGGDVRQQSFGVRLDYGITEHLAADLRIGYARVSAEASVPDESGIDDSDLGLRWLVIDEYDERFAGWPSVAVRLGGILEGSYDTNAFLTAPGDSGSGWRVDLLAGRHLDTGTSLWGSAGFRDRSSGVPSDWNYELGVAQALGGRFSTALAWQLQRAINGLNVNDVDFTFDQSPRLEEVYQRLDLSLAWQDTLGLVYRISIGHTFAGKNTPKTNAVGLTVTVPFDLHSDDEL